MVWLTWVFASHAQVAPGCVDKVPDPYHEQVQVDFLQNYIALSSTFSGIHAPVPHEPGTGGVGVDLNGIPPLPCARRFALNASKTEETNKSPVLPRLRLSFALPSPFGGDEVVPYGSVAYLPPLAVAGQRSTVLSAEGGVGVRLSDGFQLGGRFHATSMKTIADAATSLDKNGAEALDLYLANTLGFDFLVGFPTGRTTPYLAVGLTDASTYFWVGDDGVMSNNLHPYAGLALSAGLDTLLEMGMRLGLELYAAPGGHSRPDKNFENEVGFGGYGHLYTLRARVAWEFD